MSGFSSAPKNFVERFAPAIALVTIILTGAAIFTIQGAPGQAIQQWKDSSGNVVCTIGSGGILSGNCASSGGGSGNVIHANQSLTSSGILIVTGSGMFKAKAANVVPLTSRGFSAQTANLQEWQNSAGTNLVAIDSAGRLLFDTGAGGTIKDAVGGLYFGRRDVSDAIAAVGYTSHYFMNTGNNGYIGFSAQAVGSDIRGTDTAIYRNAAGVIEINEGAGLAGKRFGDLKARNIFLSGSVVIKSNQTMGSVTPQSGISLEVIGTMSGAGLSVGGSGSVINKILTATAVLDFGNLAAIGCEDLTMTVKGAASGDIVELGVPNGSTVTNGNFTAWVSSANTVSIKFCTVVSGDPASGTFKAMVFKSTP